MNVEKYEEKGFIDKPVPKGIDVKEEIPEETEEGA